MAAKRNYSFDLEPKRVMYSIGSCSYILMEASAGAAKAYRNAAIKAARMADGKVVGMDGAADVEPLLVSLCLFKEVQHPPTDGGGSKVVLKPVPLSELDTWPAKIVKQMFDEIMEMSDLGEEDTVEKLDAAIAKLEDRRDTLLAKGTDSKN